MHVLDRLHYRHVEVRQRGVVIEDHDVYAGEPLPSYQAVIDDAAHAIEAEYKQWPRAAIPVDPDILADRDEYLAWLIHYVACAIGAPFIPSDCRTPIEQDIADAHRELFALRH